MSFVQRQEMNSKIAMENKRQIIRREQLYGAHTFFVTLFSPLRTPRDCGVGHSFDLCILWRLLFFR